MQKNNGNKTRKNSNGLRIKAPGKNRALYIPSPSIENQFMGSVEMLLKANKRTNSNRPQQKVHAQPFKEVKEEKGINYGVARGPEFNYNYLSKYGDPRTQPAPERFITKTKVFHQYKESPEDQAIIDYIKAYAGFLFEAYESYPVLNDQEKIFIRNKIVNFINQEKIEGSILKSIQTKMVFLFRIYNDYYSKLLKNYKGVDTNLSKLKTDVDYFIHYNTLVDKYKTFARENLEVLLYMYYNLEREGLIDVLEPSKSIPRITRNLQSVLFPQSSE